jgi:phosphoribosylamine---glycine ligase
MTGSLNNKINVMVVGGGGREHALCWKIAQSKFAGNIYCAPGNGGTAADARITNINLPVTDFAGLTELAQDKKVDLIVIGPDNPLADGIVDYMEEKGLTVFGPRKEAAKLEWSKAHSKEFMLKHEIPTARFSVVTDFESAQKFVKENDWARVIKADGLALGKGVFVCNSETEAIEALNAIFKEGRFGDAGSTVVIEEKLLGEELSLLLLIDGKTVMPLSACQDHKRRYDGDKGPNTGGMGAYSPVRLFDKNQNAIETQVIKPIEEALKKGTLDFKGMLFAGILVGIPADAATGASPAAEKNESKDKGLTPYVLEFNARFGDPETQALMPRLKSDILPLLWASAKGSLASEQIEWHDKASVCVVLSAENYPESSSKGKTIEVGDLPADAFVFHAGTQLDGDKLLTNGGRVLALTALGDSIESARENAYKAVKQIKFADMSCRSDIALKEVGQCLST